MHRAAFDMPRHNFRRPAHCIGLQSPETRCGQGADFHRDMEGLAEQVVPQHNLRLDAQSLVGSHFGEVSCREFRDSVLHALPHR